MKTENVLEIELNKLRISQEFISAVMRQASTRSNQFLPKGNQLFHILGPLIQFFYTFLNLLCSMEQHIYSTPGRYVFRTLGSLAHFFYTWYNLGFFALFYGRAHFFYTIICFSYIGATCTFFLHVLPFCYVLLNIQLRIWTFVQRSCSALPGHCLPY